MSEDFEELEQIPWSALASTPGDGRVRNIGLAAAGIVTVLVAAVWFTSRQPSPTVTIPSAPVTPVSVAPVVPAAAVTVAPVVATPEEAQPVYSEADLMLIDVDEEQMLAIAHAEWLVRDLLTVDGDPVVSARIEELMPDAAGRTSASYVEWVKALSVESPEPGRYRVEVLYRVLVADDDGFVRTPAGALAVDLAVDVDGSAQLLGEPEEALVPTLGGLG